jgi:hypothetical protein
LPPNGKFRVANSNRRNNTVDSLVVYGSMSSRPYISNEAYLQFYNQLFSEQFCWRPNIKEDIMDVFKEFHL